MRGTLVCDHSLPPLAITLQCPGRFLCLICQDPSVSKSNRLITCWHLLVHYYNMIGGIFYKHSKRRNLNLLNVTPLISQNPRERMFSASISLLIATIPSHTRQVSALKWTTKDFKPHSRTHHVVTIAELTLCDSIMSHATLLLSFTMHPYEH